MNPHMKRAIREAVRGLKAGDGGPFGAVLVRKGRVIAAAHNNVVKTNDPTGHAEINALRIASRNLGRFDLSDCTVYSTCEPCPMCFAALHWAKITRLYQGCTRRDAEKIGFDDNYIYEAIRGTAKRRQVRSRSLDRKACLVPFRMWTQKADKIRY